MIYLGSYICWLYHTYVDTYVVQNVCNDVFITLLCYDVFISLVCAEP